MIGAPDRYLDKDRSFEGRETPDSPGVTRDTNDLMGAHHLESRFTVHDLRRTDELIDGARPASDWAIARYDVAARFTELMERADRLLAHLLHLAGRVTESAAQQARTTSDQAAPH